MDQSVSIRWNWWTAWQNSVSHRRIFAALLTVGGCSALVKLVAFGKDAVVAYQFGTGDALDAFLIALVVPQFAITLLGGALNAALIPAYIQAQEQDGQEAAQQMFSTVTVLASAFLLLMCLILLLLAPYIMPVLASGYGADKLALARGLYVVLLSTILLSGLSTTWGAVLNAGNRFAWVAVAPIVTSIFTIGAVLTLARYWDSYALAAAAVSGALVETVLLGWQLKRSGIRLWPRWHGITPATKQALGQYWPMVAAAFLMGSAHIVSQAMAATLDPGSVSALSYGNKMTAVLLGIGATAVSTAFLPHFSRMVVADDWSGIRHTLVMYSALLAVSALSVCGLLIYFSEALVALLFQRGAFTQGDTKLVGQIQAMYLLQVPPYLVGMLFVRFITAVRSTHLMLWGNALNLTVLISLTYLLMNWYGVVGIALANSAMYVVSCGFLIFVSLPVLRHRSPRYCEIGAMGKG